MEDVLKRNQFSFDDVGLLLTALDDYVAGRGDLADYVIGRRYERAGCEATVTFDRALRDDLNFRLLS